MTPSSRRNAVALAVCVFVGASALSPNIEYSISAASAETPVAAPYVAPAVATPSATSEATATPMATSTATPSATSSGTPSTMSPGGSPEVPPGGTIGAPPEMPLDTSKIDPKAQQVLQRMSAAYANLKSLALSINLSGSPEVPRMSATVNWQKPNRFAVSVMRGTSTMRTVSDGKTLFRTMSTQPKQYLKMEAPAQVQNLSGAMMAAATGEFIFSSLDSMLPAMRAPMVRSLTLSEGETPETQIVTALGALRPDGTSDQFTFVVGKKDHLLRQVRASLARGGKTIVGSETYSNLRVDPVLPAATFAFTPPKGAKMIAPPPAPLNYDARLKTGVAPFVFKTTATNAQAVSIAKYKGRVLLLDFWATWCAPCVQEMPQLKATYAKYHAQGFDILGVSLDSDRGALDGFVKSQKIAWPQVFDSANKGQIANLYGVRAIPLAILVGRDGKIVAINVQGTALDAAIKKALAKK